MADPVDEIIDTLNPQPPADPPADPPANTTQVDKAELERLQQIAKQFEMAAPTLQMLQENPGLIHDLRARIVEQQAPPQDSPDAGDYDWNDPRKSTEKIAEGIYQRLGAPAVAATNAKLASLAIQNFKATLISNPYYHVAMPIFDKKIGTLPKDQLGALPDDAILRTLNEAWNASVGEYSNQVTQERMRAKAAAEPPANLGGGSGSGAPAGPKVKRHLRDIDLVAYNMAVANGFTEEQMAELAEEIEG